jgi:hypothetical protein
MKKSLDIMRMTQDGMICSRAGILIKFCIYCGLIPADDDDDGHKSNVIINIHFIHNY